MRRAQPDHVFSARVHRHLEAASIFDRAIEASATSRPVIAAELEISATDLGRICDPTKGRAVPLEHVLGLPDDARRALLTTLADREGLALVEMPKALVATDDLRLLCEAQREASDVVTRGIEACADGHMTRTEGAEIERECDEAIAALLAVRERARLAKREGVIAIRRGAA